MRKILIIITLSALGILFLGIVSVAYASTIPTIKVVQPWILPFIAPGGKIEVEGENFKPDKWNGLTRVFVDGSEIDIGWQSITDSHWQLIFRLPIGITLGQHEMVIENTVKERSAPFTFTVTAPCTEDVWQCGEWGSCASNGQQTRTCTKVKECAYAETPSPETVQSCTYVAPVPLPMPVQTPVTPLPTTPSPTPIIVQIQNPTEQNNLDYDKVVKATVKLECATETGGVTGSGTVISADGMILTNAHVAGRKDGLGFCRIGFVQSFDEYPVFSETGYLMKVGVGIDAALVQIRSGRTFLSVPIGDLDVKKVRPGETIEIYGYPGVGGDTMTVSKGAFSGVDGQYIKTDGQILGGNSGGGSYLQRTGQFVGMPTRSVWQTWNPDDKMNQILSVNSVMQWMRDGKMIAVTENVVQKAKGYRWGEKRVEVKKAEPVKKEVKKVAPVEKKEVAVKKGEVKPVENIVVSESKQKKFTLWNRFTHFITSLF